MKVLWVVSDRPKAKPPQISMSGFRHDELADVNLITDNLRDRYRDQFSILKELVQNADDAGAHNLRFGLVPGDTGNAHPLLRGPGLVAVNDGPFTDSDFRAMCSFGLNSKAGDVATIGKYGLGMKSVFHLGEALFFIAESESQPYKELLTPWGGIRSDWDISEEQWSSEFPTLRQSWLEAVRWTADAKPFILYIPLRRKAHLQMPYGRTTGAIIENYPGDDDGVLKLLCNETTSVRLSSLLPLLRDLLSIQIYAPAGSGSLELVHSSELDPDSTRPLRKHRDGQSELSAAIATRGRRVVSVGWQRFSFTKKLDELRACPAWPASWVRDELNRECRVPNKAQPHAAAVFMQDTLPGALTIRWAVFLPVDEHEEHVPIDPGMGGYSLILHGHFFADAGRNGLYGLDESDDVSFFPNEEARVRRDWNVVLAEGSTLDLLLPALDSFCQKLGMSEERVSALTSAIKRSRTWERRKASIAASHKWLRAVTPEGFRWVLIADERTLPLPPAPREDPGRPWRVFPCLANLGDGIVLFDPSAHNLVAGDNDLGFWDEDEAVNLIRNIDVARAFTSSIDADYVARFLEQLSNSSADSVQGQLCTLLRRAADEVGLERLRSIAERVSRIAALIKPKRKLRVSLRNPGVAEDLIREDGKVLPWPKELDAGEASSETDIETLEILLRALSRCAGDAEACRLYAQELLARVDVETRRALFKRAADLAVLSAFDCRTGQKVSVSAKAMADCWQRRTLFRTGQGTTDRDRAELGLLLQGVLPGESVLTINKDLAELVLGAESAEEMLSCGARGVLSCLGHIPRDLGDIAARRVLLRSLKLPDHNPLTVLGMRFLLHGAPEHFDRKDRLWTDRADGDAAWRKLWEAVLTSDLRWTVVDPSLAEWVTRADQTALNLHSIEPEKVVKLVSEVGAPAALDLDRVEYEVILGYPHWEKETWKSLPAHLTVQGDRVRIGETTYLAGAKLQLPGELLSGATIVGESDRPDVRELQSKWIPRLDRRAALALALKTVGPEAWCEQILDWLTQIEKQFWPAMLYNTPWLKLSSGAALAPEKLIVLPDVEAEVTDLVALSNIYATPSILADDLRDHSALDLLRDRAGNLAALYSLLGIEARAALGEIEVDPDSVRQSAAIMESCPDEVARSWKLVARLCAAYGDQEAQHAFHAMVKPLAADHLRAILLWLADRAESETVFVPYLASLAKTATGPAALRGMKFRTRAGNWKLAEELCVDVPSADRGSVLCSEHRQALGQLVRRGQTQRIAHSAR